MAYQRGTGFVGLRDYLGLNKQQGEEMGGALASQIEGGVSGARGAVDAASTTLQQRVKAGTPDAQSVWMRGPDYAGPKEFGEVADLDALDKGLADAQRSAKMGATDAGRSVLLGEAHKGRPYSQGGRMLDASLAGRGAGSRLQTAATGAEKLREYLGLAKTGASSTIAAGQKQAEEVGTKFKEDVKRLQDARDAEAAKPPPVPVNNTPAPQKPIGTHPGTGAPAGGNGKMLTRSDGTKKWVPYILNEQGIYVPDPKYWP